ncbi:MAG: hypothetical protein QNK59_04000 [Flavobacteriales bacterium]|jgi:hypothetical protein|nr:hypothetical protein [Schleiferiaceae bacterium]|tara:strand:+ start:131 stop:622 length:492 start_codon:yes stop_codon:yes gene_type:complete
MEVIKDKKSLSAFKVIEGDSVILSAKGIKWYKSDLSYEHSDCKCEVIKANFWGTKRNILKNGILFGEIIWHWSKGHILKLTEDNKSFYLERRGKWYKTNHSYALLNTINSEVELVLNYNLIKWKEIITIDYDSPEQDLDKVLFSIFAFNRLQSDGATGAIVGG